MRDFGTNVVLGVSITVMLSEDKARNEASPQWPDIVCVSASLPYHHRPSRSWSSLMVESNFSSMPSTLLFKASILLSSPLKIVAT